MLTDDQKNQIRLEEIYRQEVCKSLQPIKTRKGQFLAFLNSPLGLWILSSILLTAITAAWTTWSIRRDKDRSKNERIFKMKTEINYRLSQAEEGLETREFLNMALAPMTEPTSAGAIAGPPAFPEFDKRSVKSLLIEWQTIASEVEKNNITELLEIIKMLGNLNSSEEKSTLVQQAKALIDRARNLLAT
jgi:hypothetical protein